MTIPTFGKLFASLSFFACTSVFAAPLVVDVTGVPSYGDIGNPNNTILTYNVGANAAITSIRYAVNLTAYPQSFLSDIALNIRDSNGDGFILNPGFGDDDEGNATYTGFTGLSFNVGADGLLVLEFYDLADDFPDDPDGIWNFGTITFGINGDDGAAVPEPGTTALFGAGLLLMAYAARRRRMH